MRRLIQFPLDQRADWLFVSTTAGDVGRRTAVRLGFCSIPYLAIAWTFSYFVDDRLIQSFWFWYLVVLMPAVGLLLDLWRLRRTKEIYPTPPHT